MGIFEWVMERTGVWGPAIMAFYKENSLWINTIVLVYGAVMVLAWRNLEKLRYALTDQVLEQARSRAGVLTPDKVKQATLKDFNLDWETAFQQSSFPLLAGQSSIWPVKASLESFKRLLPEKELYRRLEKPLKRIGVILDVPASKK